MDMNNYLQMDIPALSGAMRRGELSVLELTAHFLNVIEKEDPEIHAFITVDREGALRRARELDGQPVSERRGRLYGIPVSVKDNLLTRGLRTTAGSAFLRDYVPATDAEAVKRLREEGAVILGKTNLDEFGMGSKTENPVYGSTVNPGDPERSPGGSSGGAAAALASGMCLLSFGTDTGGSVRQPAAYCGMFGIKPTYGAVSRNGLVAYASSMDTVGVIARNAADAALALSVIAGEDPKDSTSVPLPADYALMTVPGNQGEKTVPDDHADMTFSGKALKDSLQGLSVGIPEEFLSAEPLSDESRAAVSSFAAFLTEYGASVTYVHLPETELLVPVYYMLASCEASSNLGRYDGIRYGTDLGTQGPLSDVYLGNRTAGFSPEVRRRILAGTYILSEEHYTELYLRAERARARIRRAYRKALSSCDILLCPVVRGKAPLLSGKAPYDDDLFTVGANLAGLPACAVPVGPSSVQLVGRPMAEGTLLSAAGVYEAVNAGERRTGK